MIGGSRGGTVRTMMGPRDNPHLPKAVRLRKLAIAAYWAASTPLEAKMAGILCDLFAPDVSGYQRYNAPARRSRQAVS